VAEIADRAAHGDENAVRAKALLPPPAISTRTSVVAFQAMVPSASGRSVGTVNAWASTLSIATSGLIRLLFPG
jgi:hypothetical protein